jgi:hypothetical protein
MSNTESIEQEAGALSHLSGELGNLRGKLTELNNEQSKIRCLIKEKELELVKIQHKVYVGCVVKNKYGVLFEVSKIDTSWQSKPPIYGHRQKKDGLYSLSEQYIGQDWEMVA